MLCKRNKKLSWMQSINSSRTSTKEKKRVLNRKLSLEIYSRFEFSLLFPSSFPPPHPPTPCFSFCLWQFSIPICSFVCMFVHQLSRLFGPLVRLLCLWSFSVYLFSVRVSFPPHPQSPVQTGKWNKNRHVLRSRCQFLSDRLVMRRYWKYNYISSLLFHLSGT